MTVIQRLELLAEDVKNLENGGGGGDLSAYLTKEEASTTYETQTSASSALALKADKATTYTKTEVDEAIASAGGDLDLSPVYMGVALSNNVVIPEDKRYAIEKHLPITFSSSIETTRETYVFTGSSNNSSNPYSSYYFYTNSSGQGFKTLSINRGSYMVVFCGKSGYNFLNYINNSQIRNAMFDPTKWDEMYYNGTYYPDGKAASISANGDFNSGIGTGNGCGLYRASAEVAPTLLNCPTEEAFYLITDKYAEDGVNKYSQTIVENSGARFFKRGKNSDNTWTDWYKFSADVETATSTEALPSAGTGTTFDTGIEWTYIQTLNDFILDSGEQKIKFRYGFTKGSFLHYFGYALGSGSIATIVHLSLGAPTGSGTTALAEWVSSGAIPTT